jgi:hypothetical protein
MRGGIQQNLMLVLSMQIDERSRQLAQGARRRERAVDECPAAPTLRRDVASYDQLRSILPFENGFDDRRFLTGSDEIAGRAPSGNETDGAHEYRFAGTCLAGKDTQTRLELQLEMIDDGEIADAEEP